MGAIAGAAVFFKHKYGLFLEGGWRLHSVWDNGTRGLLNQGVIHVGNIQVQPLSESALPFSKSPFTMPVCFGDAGSNRMQS